MSDIYFFTDVDLLNDQTAEQAFGPVSGCEDTQYRVTSMHTATANPCAYAVCDGIIKIQDSDLNPDNLVNIILKPSSHQKINGVEIKYFIYRGILKESIVNMSKVDELALNEVYNIDMLTTIWQNQDVYEQNVENNIPCSKILYGEQPYYATISDLFEEDNLNYCDYVCKAGESIGVFHKDCIGFEIVQNTMFTDDSIIMAKSPEHIINVENTEGYSNGEIKAIREQVLHYIDPAAFYGTQSSVVSTNNNILSTKFLNRNSIYINLLSTTGFSLFFYDIIEKISFNEPDEEIVLSPWPIIKGELNSDLIFNNEIIIKLEIKKIFFEQLPDYLIEEEFYYFKNNCSLIYNDIYFSETTINSKYFKVRFKYSLGITNISQCCMWDNLFFVKEFNIETKNGIVLFDSNTVYYTPQIGNDSIYKINIFHENERLFFFAYCVDAIFKQDNYQYKSVSDFFREEMDCLFVRNKIKVSESKTICFLSLFKRLFNEINKKIYVLCMSNQEYQNIINLAHTVEWNQFHPVFFQHIPEQQEDFEDCSDNPQNYKAMDLRLCGLKKDNCVEYLDVNIKLYSSDELFFCTKLNANEYTNYDIEPIREHQEGNITFIFNESLINDIYFLQIISILIKLETFHNICLYLRKVSNKTLNITVSLHDNFNSHKVSKTANAYYEYATYTLHLNKSKLQFHEPVSVIRTCVHEMIHAYIFWIKDNAFTKYPGVQDFYTRFKNNDDSSKYMSAQHNHMAYAYRPIMIKAMKEYDALIGITNRSGNIKYINFSGLEVSYDYTTEEFYIALSWCGLVRTKNENDKNNEGEATAYWRHLASKNRDKYLTLLVIAYRVLSGAKYCNDGVYDTSKFVNPNVFNL